MKFTLLLFTLLAVSTSIFSQERRTFGISGSVQDNQFGILVPIWLGEKFVLAPAFEYKSIEGIGSEFGFALAPRFYFKEGKVAPYIGLKAGVIRKKFNGSQVSPIIDHYFMGGLAFGGEYFLSEHFSLGVEVQGNMSNDNSTPDRYGSAQRRTFNTGTMILATFYL